MYSWGPDTRDWKKPGKYKYDSARSPYLDKLADDSSIRGPRTYTRSDAPDMKLVDSKGKTIETASKNPVVVAVDVTGSMASWPGEIFDRLPLLYQTLSQYRDDLEVCFAAIGDANCDSYPLQVNDFGKGVELEDKLKALGCEGGGGGQISETYELFAYFMQEHCNVKNATSPFLLIYGDEKFYNKVDPRQIEHYIGDKVQGKVDSNKVFKGILDKFNVYFMHKPYGHGNCPDVDSEVVAHWADAIGKQRIIELPSYDRAVDVGLGLIAKQWGEFGDFKENLSARQDETSVRDSVYASLRYIPDKPSKKSIVKSRKTKKTKSLSKMFSDAKKR